MDKNRIGALLVYCSDTHDPQDLEGILTERDIIELVARKGLESLKGEVNEIMSNVRSGMSYSGARNLCELREAQFVLQTQNAHSEGQPHIYRKY